MDPIMDERGLVWRSSSTRSNGGGVAAMERPRASTPNCPRCGSSNTKFCYYNNYSLSQPRFFCKSCRRYWTKGGSLRNVPVGGASRKSRNHRTIRSSSLPPPPPSYHHHHNNNIINTTKPSLSHGSGSHIDLAVVYANFLNTTSSSSNPQLHHQLPPPPALVHGNVDPAGGEQDPMMMQYYCRPEGCGNGLDDAWTASNDHQGGIPLLPPAGDQGISLFHVSSSSSNPHHQEEQLPPPDHGYSDLMMMFGNSAWSSFEISAAADLNLR